MSKALLLDRNYMALTIVTWKKALKLMVNGKAEAVFGSSVVREIRSAQSVFGIPSIIRLTESIPWRAHTGRIKFSRKNLIARDNGVCQYCGLNISKNYGTIDHIIPRSRGGKTDYINCVFCCGECNNTKANRTPEEAGMKLLKRTRRPSFANLHSEQLEDSPEEWEDFIIGLCK